MTGAILMASGLVPNTDRTVIMNRWCGGDREPVASGVAPPREIGRLVHRRVGDLDAGQGPVHLRLVSAVVIADVERSQDPLYRLGIAGTCGGFKTCHGTAKI